MNSIHHPKFSESSIFLISLFFHFFFFDVVYSLIPFFGTFLVVVVVGVKHVIVVSMILFIVHGEKCD